jgi:penicillin-binding protein 2
MDTASPRFRMSVVGVVVVGCFLALFARLWYLQVLEAPELEVQATANRTRTVSVEAPRGRIIDVNGRVIVDNRTSLVVTVDRSDLTKVEQSVPGTRDALVAKLAATFTDFGTPTKIDAIEARLGDSQYDELQPVPVASDISEDLMVFLSEHAAEYPGVDVTRKAVRQYNYGAAAGNVLGYVGRITAQRLAAAQDDPGVDPDGVPKTYQPDSTIGLAGVEATYEKELRGTPGTEILEIDAQNRPVGTVSYQAPRPGNDIQLNIDIELQIKAEEALREQLRVTRDSPPQRDRYGVYEKNAPAGAAVVTDPNNGAVRALATFPSYDPAEFVNGISQERYTELTGTESTNALIDRSISGVYAPGSTFKLVTATAAVNSGLINRNTSYDDKGVYEVGGQQFSSTGRNGVVNLPRALTVSSDVYFYWLGERMDELNYIQDTAGAYGFDATTGIDLPNESAGYVYTPAEKAALHEEQPEAYPNPTPWYTGDNVQLAIGQNTVGVTPIQLTGAYAALANGGTVWTPHVVARVLAPATEPRPLNDPVTFGVLRTIDPLPDSQVDLPPGTRDPIIEGLAAVTSSGTASAAFDGFDQRAFPIVGKTGTAQVDGKADTSVFTSYGPGNAPRFAVTAFLEEAGFGSEAAAPVVRHIYEFLADQEQTGYAFVIPTTQD